METESVDQPSDLEDVKEPENLSDVGSDDSMDDDDAKILAEIEVLNKKVIIIVVQCLCNVKIHSKKLMKKLYIKVGNKLVKSKLTAYYIN